jgi:hypothetical protein
MNKINCKEIKFIFGAPFNREKKHWGDKNGKIVEYNIRE